MEVFNDFLKIEEPLVITIGTYDAIHIGHLEIINRMMETKIKNAIISFYPPPFIYFGFENHVLFTLNEKIEILKDLNINYLFSLKFDEKIKNLDSRDFIEIIIKFLNVKKIIVGDSFKFGKDRKGNKEILIDLGKKINFDVETVEEKKINNEKISSSKIRKFIEEGYIEKANEFLVKNYFIYIKKENDKYLIDRLKLLPKDGVYEVKINENDKKILNIDQRKLYFNENIDLKEFRLEFLKRLK
jgi:riboflavin kinase/FMN adenylyltransferase